MIIFLRMRTFMLLFLPFLLVILIKESHALTEEPVDSLLETTTPVSIEEEETTTFSPTEIDSSLSLDNSDKLTEDEETTTILSLAETTIDNEPESSTSSDFSGIAEEHEEQEGNTEPSVDDKVETVEEESASPDANTEKRLSSDSKRDNLQERTNLPIKEVNNDSNLLSSKDLAKRILLEPPTESNPDPVNEDTLPKVEIDAWRPVWPYSNLETVAIRPTVRFPSIEVSQPAVESSLRSYPEPSYSVSKEPVTAYYFDLSSVAPTKQVGPLFDPSYILENLTSKVPTNNLPSRGTELSLGSSVDDLHSLNSNLEGNINIPNPEKVPIIEPTPTIMNPPSSFENEKIPPISTAKESSVISEEGMTFLHNFEKTTIASLHSRPVTELQYPTPSYTLGGSDFHFTRKNVNNSTNISEPVILPSILSSDHLLESQSSTGDPSYKISQSLNTASLFKIPIDPSELPSPIFSTVVDRTQESTILTSTAAPRIPLWKRLSQKKPSTSISSQAPTLDLPSDKTVLISTTVETPVYSSVPFENDIPIGILSPDSKVPPPANKTGEENVSSKDGEDAFPIEEEGDFFVTTPVNNVSGEAVQDPQSPLEEEEDSGVLLVGTTTDEPSRPDSEVVIEKEKTSTRPKTSTTKDPISVLDPVSEVSSSTISTSTSTTEDPTTTTTSTTTSTSTSTTSSSTTTTTTTTTEPPLPPPSPPPSTTSSTSTTTTEANVPDNLEWRPPTFESGANDVNETSEGNLEEEEEKEIMVVVSGSSDSEPELNLVKMHRNGTNSSFPSPFLKAAVSYDIIEFCKHQNKIEALLGEWINGHLGNYSDPNKYEVEIFYQPDCENLYILNGTSEELDNKTSLYFYVKHNGEISPNLTLNYPINPTQLEISQELEYLRKKILHLELINASSTDDILLEEAAVGTSIVVVVVVTTLLVILFICGLFAFYVVKRRKSAENSHGRRCTPAVNDAYSLDSVSVFYHSLRRKSKKRASNKSLKSYLNQGFDDPNSPSRPLNFAKLTHFITDNEAIYEEFTNIPSVVPKYDEMPRGVEDKNRYANVIPVPETRVLLGGLKSTPSSEYINANTIHGPRGELRYYVATQAPLDNTVADFWQMVWEQESKVIVMLTDFVEKGIDKCADYLPPSETLDCHRVYREFQITLKSRDMREQYIVSLLQIKNLENNLVREIAHMWFTGWPQSGVPTEEKLFISFIFDVRTTRKQLRAKGPIIVHCSPGTGRTGTYIACDLCIRQFEEQRVVDIPKTVFRIRRERAGAIQTRDQYAFIYRVVNLYAAKLSTGNLDSF